MKPNLSSQGGQLIVEAVLILVLLFGATMLVANYFKKEELLVQLIQAPWKNLSGMLSNGVWNTPEASYSAHPNAHGRHISIVGQRE